MVFNLSQMLTEIGTGIGSFLPSVMSALLHGFESIFLVTTGTGETAVTTLSPVGTIALLFIIIGACYKFIPTIVGWLRLSVKRKARKKARSK